MIQQCELTPQSTILRQFDVGPTSSMSVLRRESDCIIGPTSETRREPSSSDADERGLWPMGQHRLSAAACVSVTAYRASAFCWPPFSILNLFVCFGVELLEK